MKHIALAASMLVPSAVAGERHRLQVVSVGLNASRALGIQRTPTDASRRQREFLAMVGVMAPMWQD